MSHVMHLISHVTHLMSHVTHLMSHVTHVMSHVTHVMSHVSGRVMRRIESRDAFTLRHAFFSLCRIHTRVSFLSIFFLVAHSLTFNEMSRI